MRIDVAGRVGTTTLNSMTHGATHESPKPPGIRSLVNSIGEATSRYSAMAIPRLASTSNPRPRYTLTFGERRGEETSSATATPPTMDTTEGSHRLGKANIIARL